VLPLDSAEDVPALARLLAGAPRLGVVRVGEGAADALIAQARVSAALLGVRQTTFVGSVTLGVGRPVAAGEGHIAVAADAALTLPLLLTGLAQRVPGSRRAAPRRVVSVRHAEAALA
jgi:hypothetical protein